MDKHPGKETGTLQQYASGGSEAAFARLVDRHIKLVYSVCLRELGRTDLAEDATQLVFITLAQKAGMIHSEAELARWLYTTARFKASTLRKQEQVRMAREQQAGDMAIRQGQQRENDAWNEIEPELNDAIHSLNSPDQEAILLRYFEDLSLREVGQAMGTNEVAARMRVSRALAKLRAALVSRKAATISTGVLAALLAERAVYAVPEHLSVAVAQSAASATSSIPSAPPTWRGGGWGRGLSPLNPLIAKGLLIVSTTKIVAGAIAAAILIIAFGIFAMHRANHAQIGSTGVRVNNPAQVSAAVWQAPAASDPATQAAERQIQAQCERFGRGLVMNDRSEILAVVSPDIVVTRPGMPSANYQQLAANLPPNPQPPLGGPDESTTAKFETCSINGSSATVRFDVVSHDIVTSVRGNGRRGAAWRGTEIFADRDQVMTGTLVNTSGQWLFSRLDWTSSTIHPIRTVQIDKPLMY